jgi:hypothetical protein
MNAAMPEPRSAVMIVVEASWKDRAGAMQTVAARMEDKSTGGACIRLKTAIEVGAKLRIQWRFEQFSGVVKYCRREGREFVVGLQRDKTLMVEPAVSPAAPQETAQGSEAITSPGRIEKPMERQESKAEKIPAGKAVVQHEVVRHEPIMQIAGSVTARGERSVREEIDIRNQARGVRPQMPSVLRGTEVRATEIPKRKETAKERKPMKRKWLDLAPWHHKQEGLSVSGNGHTQVNGGGKQNGNGNGNAKNLAPHTSSFAEKIPADSAGDAMPNFQIELLPLDDVYLAAGIVHTRGGVHKVVEMLRSEHIRGLSQDMKRAAVLMALEIAGVSIEQVRQDAKARQDALDSYEGEQRKQAQAEWARKAEENIKIQAELERIKTQYMTRITRNLEGVAREQSAFSNWQTAKRQETQSISEAADLCVKPVVADAVGGSVAAEIGHAASAGAKLQ